jgi:hypothetical protein
MEQYKAYLEETYPGESCYIDDERRGWASYKINGDECYIVHCFVAKEFRNKQFMSSLCGNIERIALSKGCKYMTGTVDLSSSNPERSLRMQMTDGYKLHSANNNVIVLIKDLGA